MEATERQPTVAPAHVDVMQDHELEQLILIAFDRGQTMANAGAAIRELRRRHGKTFRQIHEATGVPITTIYGWSRL